MSEMEFCDRWPAKAIATQCGPSFAEFKAKGLDEHHRAFFRANPHLANEHHVIKARDLEAALPPGYAHLAKLLPTGRHIHYLSGGSSQVLALALLGSAWEAHPDLSWLATLLGEPGLFADESPRTTFEASVDEALLDERPNVTSLDLLVDDGNTVICLEAKYQETGMGKCSCNGTDPGSSLAGRCAAKVLRRDAYWETSRDVFGFRERVDERQCPIEVSYQAVRNVAAACALANGRRAVFALAYDERNPYFSGSGDWPGWVAELKRLLAPAEATRNGKLLFRAFSWQRLLGSGAIPDDVVDWAREKHLLDPVHGA
jgi:hypothetical protein